MKNILLLSISTYRVEHALVNQVGFDILLSEFLFAQACCSSHNVYINTNSEPSKHLSRVSRNLLR